MRKTLVFMLSLLILVLIPFCGLAVVDDVWLGGLTEDTTLYTGNYRLHGTTSQYSIIANGEYGGEINITLDNATIHTTSKSSIRLENNAVVNLTLVGYNEIISQSYEETYIPIEVPYGCTLTIDEAPSGSNKLKLLGNADESPAIGGKSQGTMGRIIIRGGHINTMARIGIGRDGNPADTAMGEVIIYGGKVENHSLIGIGTPADDHGKQVRVTIHGGEVIADGGLHSICAQELIIHGGLISAEDGILIANGHMTVNGGDLVANRSIELDHAQMTVNGGQIISRSITKQIIPGIHLPEGSQLIVNNGVITAEGGPLCAGIGGSIGENGGQVTINGGIVHAQGGDGGAGIGGGLNGNGGHVRISNTAKVNAKAGKNFADFSGAPEDIGHGCAVLTVLSSGILEYFDPAASTPPRTGDSSMPLLWTLMSVLSLSGVCVILKKRTA